MLIYVNDFKVDGFYSVKYADEKNFYIISKDYDT